MIPQSPGRRLSVLVAIASFGEKNLTYLRNVIANYRRMPYEVRIVVLSEAPKSVDLGVEVRVGLPSRNPFSLPFAHHRLFADNVGKYDLYIYTEDDINLTDEGIRRFLDASSRLGDDEVPGFLRYEVGPDGTESVPDVHGRFHWIPSSARRRGRLVTAEFTNEHAGIYLLTNAQLQRAVRSGRFVSPPYEGRYEMLESAATHVYVNCGLRKVICVSELDHFLVHHMPNRYAGTLGVPLASLRRQAETLSRIADGAHPATTLCQVEPSVMASEWSKRYDEPAPPAVVERLPARLSNALSIGAGSGAIERELCRRGAAVTALPLDSVVGSELQAQGIRVVYGALAEGLARCAHEAFDYVIVTNLLHLQPDPDATVRTCADRVAPGGTLIIHGPTTNWLILALKRGLDPVSYGKATRFATSGLRMSAARAVARAVRRAGLQVVHKSHATRAGRVAAFAPEALSSTSWVVQGARLHPRPPALEEHARG